MLGTRDMKQVTQDPCIYLRNSQSGGEAKDGIPWVPCMVREGRLMSEQLPSKLGLSECGCVWLCVT